MTNNLPLTDATFHAAPAKPGTHLLAWAVALSGMFCQPAMCQSTPLQHNTSRTLSGEVFNGSASGGSQEGAGVALRYTERLSAESSNIASAIPTDRINSLEWRRQSRLNETGQQLAAQQTRSIGSGRNLTAGINVSDSFLFPSWGLTGVFEQNWRNPWLRATRIGLSYQTLKNDQKQTALLLEQTGQFAAGPIWQIGRQQGLASPGQRSFHANHVALQYVSADRWRAVIRRQWSREASALLIDGSNAQGFKSQSLRVSTGVEWMPGGWINVFHERYDTPFYERRQTGVSVEQSW